MAARTGRLRAASIHAAYLAGRAEPSAASAHVRDALRVLGPPRILAGIVLIALSMAEFGKEAPRTADPFGGPPELRSPVDGFLRSGLGAPLAA